MKITTIDLTPEHVTRVYSDHRDGSIVFETDYKGAAGAVMHVRLPEEAVIEATGTFHLNMFRVQSFPPVEFGS